MSTIHEINEGWQEFALQPTWAQLHKAQTEYDELRARVVALEKDAERYRWIVSVCESDGFGYWLPEVCLKEGNLPPSKAESDAAIDAAMESE